MKVDIVCETIIHVICDNKEYWMRNNFRRRLSQINEIMIDYSVESRMKCGYINSDVDIINWLTKNNIKWPLTEEERILFKLTWD